jgi:hypothetical protein
MILDAVFGSITSSAAQDVTDRAPTQITQIGLQPSDEPESRPIQKMNPRHQPGR